MITFHTSNARLGTENYRSLILFSFDDLKSDSMMQHVATAFEPHLELLMAQAKFTGKNSAMFVHNAMVNGQVKIIVIMGLGSHASGPIAIETYRRAVGKAIKYIQSKKIASATLLIPEAQFFAATPELLMQETVITAAMAEYHFDEFITNPERKITHEFSLELVSQGSTSDTSAVLERGRIIGEAVNQARHWIDLPSKSLTPYCMVRRAQTIASKYNLSCTVFGEDEVVKMGMGGLGGVSAGSDQDCALVIMEYKTSQPDAPTLALVGKGVTFDSGGLSIKPAEAMETMKQDMSGAAAVINTMQVIAQLKPEINIVALAPLTENLPSGKALKPGDIISFYNGKTAEVRNTDAEGRLILADALSYAVKHYHPDAIIDIATLTGACAYALGPFFAGMMSKHDDLAARVKKSADRSGDYVWALPFTDDYKVAVRSQVADICNIGSRKYRAGAITAGFFLLEFVGDIPWVHLDIAGVASEVPDISYYSYGATGFGVRLFVDLVMNWNN